MRGDLLQIMHSLRSLLGGLSVEGGAAELGLLHRLGIVFEFRRGVGLPEKIAGVFGGSRIEKATGQQQL